MGINGGEFIVLIVLAMIILGPERLPEYASKLADFIKGARAMAADAKTKLKDETGTDFDEVDWRKYDPRNYDPRRIIKEALTEDDNRAAIAAASAAAAQHSAQRQPPALQNSANQEPLEQGQRAPYDDEAT